MRALWERYGKPGTRVPGYVETPYTNENLKTVLGVVSGDAAFATDFFARFIEGRDVVDFPRLLARAGLLLRPLGAGRGYAGAFRLQDVGGGARIATDVSLGSPAYVAGLDRDDVIVSIGGTAVARAADVERAIAARKPGDPLPVVFDRRGERISAAMTLAEDPRRELIAAEDAGQAVTEDQRRFRDRWLGGGF
jgi:predicted metalloprotease with PDZ domain